MTVTVKGYFWRTLALTSTWALMNGRKLQNSLKIYLHGIGSSSASIGLQRFPRCHFKDNGPTYF